MTIIAVSEHVYLFTNIDSSANQVAILENQLQKRRQKGKRMIRHYYVNLALKSTNKSNISKKN